MSKFNVGDKVKLRDDLTVKEMNTEPFLTEDMWEFMRREQFRTIDHIIEEDNCVTLKGDDDEYFYSYFYSEDWLELVELAIVHDFKVGDYVKMVEPAEYYIEATLGNIYEITNEDEKGYTIIVDNGNKQYFSKYSYRFGKFVKVEDLELTLKEIADKFNIPIDKLRIKD